jgi:transposase-like protein
VADLAVRSSVAGVPYSPNVIMVAVLWSLHDGLSDQDVGELLAKLG